MTTYLLDVNVLIALVDSSHIQHEKAHSWFSEVGRKSFATCPLTENGLVRIIGHPKYPNSPGPPGIVMQSLRAIRAFDGHVFWPDSISIADESFFSQQQLSSHARVTDSYLLALAHANKGRLATMDRRLGTEVTGSSKPSLEIL